MKQLCLYGEDGDATVPFLSLERKVGSPMVMHTAPLSVAVSTATEILMVIAAEEPPGATADQVARALGLGLDGDTVQGEMEELVARGLLDRRGLGYGALYTRHMTS